MAATKSVKVKDTENLSDANIEKVVALLNSEKPITKKAACEILNISYNTTRLQAIIDQYQSKKEETKKKKAEKKYKPPTSAEIKFIIENSLEGDTITNISKRLYRSPVFVNNILNRVGVPRRATGASYFHPELVPEICMKSEFKVGEKVFSMRYNSLATIKYESDKRSNKSSKVYAIFLEDEKWLQSAFQPAEELASLEHLKQYGVNI